MFSKPIYGIGIVVALSLGASKADANPYPLQELVPLDLPLKQHAETSAPVPQTREQIFTDAVEALRVQVDWDETSDTFRLGALKREATGTQAFLRRATKLDPLGSYKAELLDAESGAVLGHDSIGTGQEYRRLARALTFRFPMPTKKSILRFYAENPASGVLEKALESQIDPAAVTERTPIRRDVEVKLLKASTSAEKLLVNIYAEGYPSDQKNQFWDDARHAVDVLLEYKFPRVEQFEFRAVFASSAVQLGQATDLGLPVKERNSFLGLYFPYWRKFGRWYHVVYPTREARFRDGVAQAPYDYPIVLIYSREYWGVGNYKEFTAIPSTSSRFAYLLMHEIGHFFGLNEEYEGGGATELAFAPGIREPWSQNITFLRDREHSQLKWKQFVPQTTPLPTPKDQWSPAKPSYGAYAGGYGDTEPYNHSHKPGFSCVMERYRDYCPICLGGLEEVLRRDLGSRL